MAQPLDFLITDQKTRKNAMSIEWPDYQLRCDNTLVVNDHRQLALRKDSKTDIRFQVKIRHPPKQIKTTLKFGLAKDSPFHTQYTVSHPNTKQILDYANNNLKPDQTQLIRVDGSFEKIDLDEQLRQYRQAQRPKMFTMLMRQGSSREKHKAIARYFCKELNQRITRAASLDRSAPTRNNSHEKQSIDCATSNPTMLIEDTARQMKEASSVSFGDLSAAVLQKNKASPFACRYEVNQGSRSVTPDKQRNFKYNALSTASLFPNASLRKVSELKKGKGIERQTESEIALRTLREQRIESAIGRHISPIATMPIKTQFMRMSKMQNSVQHDSRSSIGDTRRDSRRRDNSDSSKRTMNQLFSLTKLTTSQLGDQYKHTLAMNARTVQDLASIMNEEDKRKAYFTQKYSEPGNVYKSHNQLCANRTQNGRDAYQLEIHARQKKVNDIRSRIGRQNRVFFDHFAKSQRKVFETSSSQHTESRESVWEKVESFKEQAKSQLPASSQTTIGLQTGKARDNRRDFTRVISASRKNVKFGSTEFQLRAIPKFSVTVKSIDQLARKQ